MSRIIVTVDGGIAEVDQSSIPEGIEVEIRNYTVLFVYGCDDIKKDDDGADYVGTLWSRVT